MKKIGIIGHFGGNKTFTDGQTVKTKEINNQIESHYGIETIKFDTYKKSHNPFSLFMGVRRVLKKSDIVILIVSERGYKIINILLNSLNKVYKKRLFDFVIGGTRYKVYDKSKKQKKNALKFEKIYVETNNMKKEYEKRQLNNVEVFPNFKKIELQDSSIMEDNKLKLCTFSRIRKEKGIEDSITAVELANKKIRANKIHLDIYGIPDKDYAEQFEKIKENFSNNIEYKGLVQPNESTSVIKNYDAMLFLTYWRSEGFPGTIIDSFFSGVPVIATDWNCNFEVLKENYTGIKTEINNPEKVSNLLVDLIHDKRKLLDMRRNCTIEAKKYLPENIMKIFYNQIEEDK